MAGTQTGQTAQGQNLINPSKVTTGGRREGFWRALSLDIVSILAAGFFGFSYYRYLADGWSVWYIFGALMLFGVTSVIQVFLARTNERRALVVLIEALAALAFFWRANPTILGITALVLFFMLAWGYTSARMQLRNSIEMPFFGVSGNMLSKYTTGVLLFMILVYVPSIGSNALLISQKNFGTFFDWTAGVVNGFYPELTLNGSFGDFAQSFAKMELQNNPNFQNLNTAQQNAAIQEAANQFAQNFSSNSSTVAVSSPTSDAFYHMLNGVLSAWQNQSSGWFDIGWVTILFIGLRTLGVLFVWLAQFVSLIFYELLLATGFMKVTEQTRSQEMLVY